MSRMTRMSSREHGAIFVQVGIAIFVLMAFNVFVLDYGVMWIARGQAQNAADAGALAGAVARGYDDSTDPPHRGRQPAAQHAPGRCAPANLMWQQAGTPVAYIRLPGRRHGQLRARRRLSRRQPGSNRLNTLFGPILGVTGKACAPRRRLSPPAATLRHVSGRWRLPTTGSNASIRQPTGDQIQPLRHQPATRFPGQPRRLHASEQLVHRPNAISSTSASGSCGTSASGRRS